MRMSHICDAALRARGAKNPRKRQFCGTVHAPELISSCHGGSAGVFGLHPLCCSARAGSRLPRATCFKYVRIKYVCATFSLSYREEISKSLERPIVRRDLGLGDEGAMIETWDQIRASGAHAEFGVHVRDVHAYHVSCPT